MPKKTPQLPAIISTFALLDVQKGRAPLEKIVSAGYKIPVTITGYIQNGKSGVGGDDGVSREFSIDVDSVELRTPVLVPADKIGRPWALVNDLRPGDKITLDDGFSCSEPHKARKVFAARDTGELYFKCEDGRHYLSGQIGDHGEFIGVYKAG